MLSKEHVDVFFVSKGSVQIDEKLTKHITLDPSSHRLRQLAEILSTNAQYEHVAGVSNDCQLGLIEMREEFSCGLVFNLVIAEQSAQLLENLLERVRIKLNTADLLFLVRSILHIWLFWSDAFWQVVIVLLHLCLDFQVTHQITFRTLPATVRRVFLEFLLPLLLCDS